MNFRRASQELPQRLGARRQVAGCLAVVLSAATGILLQASPSSPAEQTLRPGVREATGETRTMTVRAATFSWSEPRPRAARLMPPEESDHMGFFPGYEEWKRQANERALAAAGPSSTSQPALPPLPLVEEFDGPDEVLSHGVPPDPVLAAGPDHVVVVVNFKISIYNKAGTLLGMPSSLADFYAPLGLPVYLFFDSRILYDDRTQRFFITTALVDFSSASKAYVLVAVSQTSDPTGKWNEFALDWLGQSAVNGEATFGDFPTTGISPTAFYIATNGFGIKSAIFSDVWVRVIQLPELLAGNPNLRVTTFKNVMGAFNMPAFSLQPALSYGDPPAEFLVGANFNSTPNFVLDVFSISLNAPPIMRHTALQVPLFSLPPNAPQSGTDLRVQTNDFRTLNAVWRANSLYTAQSVADSTGANPVAQWYQIAASTLASLALEQTGTVAGAGAAYYPAITVNSGGYVGLSFTTSSPTTFPSAGFSGRHPTDPAGTMRPAVISRPGAGWYYEANRWGDYSGASVDPVDDRIWIIAECAETSNPHYLTGVGEIFNPSAQFSTESLDFGEQVVGVATAPVPVSLSNTGEIPLEINSLAVQGDFSQQNSCNSTLLAGLSCMANVTFAPRLPNRRQGTLSANTDAPDSPERVQLSGIGTYVSLSASSLSFGSQKVTVPSPPQRLTVTNTWRGPISISAIVVPPDFPMSGTCAKWSVLGAGSNCSIDLSFKPRGVGPIVETLSLYDNGGGSPQQVTLTGTGTP